LDCRGRYADIRALRRSGTSLEYLGLAMSAHWPDDPTRQLRTLTLPKFGLNAGVMCARRRRQAEREGRSYSLGISGLLCASHAGDLQFMHAMASAPLALESAEQSREKMLDWAVFAFEVATARLDANSPYCATLRSRADTISTPLAPADFPFCDERPRHGGGAWPGWTIGTLFSFECSRPFDSSTCSDRHVGSDGTIARRNAAGAILHLIQDSYSQSHTVRGPLYGGGTERRPMAIVDCTLPSRFYYYNEQRSSRHKRADQIPTAADSCVVDPDDGANDAITASALAMRHIRDRSDPGTFRCFLEDRVLGRTSRSRCPDRSAG
ncbi:MAG TPA: hypothetical protein VJS15_07210, partial [Allosphingosinicella sp.]|nr:hypothetical protein [Allosphingosinicella sp.]